MPQVAVLPAKQEPLGASNDAKPRNFVGQQQFLSYVFRWTAIAQSRRQFFFFNPHRLQAF
jgi:hypothetical protein